MPNLIESNLKKLPDFCYAYHPTTQQPIRIFKGENGYYEPINDDIHVEEVNGLLGVTVEQEEAMLYGSIFGWDSQAADPDTWLDDEKWQEKVKEEGRKQ